MELVNWVIDNKITSSEFGDDQKASCHLGLELLNQLDLVKDGDWLQNYESAVYSIFNRLNRTVRDGERDTVRKKLSIVINLSETQIVTTDLFDRKTYI